MPNYIILFSELYKDFRRQELESLAILEHINMNILHYNDESPYLIIRLNDDKQAKSLIQRSICSRAIYEFWTDASNYIDFHIQLRQLKPSLLERFRYDSYKFVIKSVNKSHSMEYQMNLINSFSYLDFEGPVSMNHPDQIYAVLEEWSTGISPSLLHIYIGRLVAISSRHIIGQFDLKKRRYIGNTSMDAELSLIAANQALADKGKLVYDPFVGTGSFLFACAYYGAIILGSDIDGRLLRGRNGKSIQSNLDQYDLTSKFLDVFIMDFGHLALRSDFLLDAIICDPLNNGRKNDYIPPMKPYQFDDMIKDLMKFASEHLSTQGRLVFWIPSIVDDNTNIDIPKHPNLLLIANSIQCFGKWFRTLLTYERKDRMIFNENTTTEKVENKFREKVSGFLQRLFSY
ncbi:hypothetical protein PCK1_002646 [Pneumocystis canis]|nr:hypothetical protein PCK1_002646 [Pneumocystis canis]